MRQSQPDGLAMSEPLFADMTSTVTDDLQAKSERQLTKLLDVSDTLGKLNYDRYQQWADTPTRAALWMYSGDVYNGIDAYTMDQPAIDYAQQHLLIVSGLYGLVRPLDAVRPYRLEMRLRYSPVRTTDLYSYWHDAAVSYLKERHPKTILLCASKEYSKLITETTPASTRLITSRFYQQAADGSLKEKGLFAKYARGALARWVIDNQVTNPDQLSQYNGDGFVYSSDLSTDKEAVFIIPSEFSLKGRFIKR